MKKKDNNYLIPGFRASSIASGIKKEDKSDLALIVSDRPASSAAVFTTNAVKSASILLSQERMKKGICQAIIINSGNANTCTGDTGLSDARLITEHLAGLLNVDPELVLIASTGIIGRRLPLKKIRNSLPDLAKNLDPERFPEVAKAIMTTDNFAKIEFQRGLIDEKEVHVCGIAKGAGMIMPNMATMLSFIITDVAVEHKILGQILRDGVEQSFNCITVDGETSTNDMVVVLANGAAENSTIERESHEISTFKILLNKVLKKLARMIVKDGEGATKFIEIEVKGAKTIKEAKKVAFTIANSPLVKTAFYGKDPNWGRIMAAVGRSGVPVDPDKIDIYFDQAMIVKDGIAFDLSSFQEVRRILEKSELRVTIDLKAGRSEAQVLTTDLTHEYIKINADYSS